MWVSVVPVDPGVASGPPGRPGSVGERGTVVTGPEEVCSASAEDPRPVEQCGRLLAHHEEPATPWDRESARSELPRRRSCPGHRRGQNHAREGESEDRAAQHVDRRLPPAPSLDRLRRGHVVGLHGSDKVLRRLGQPDQMNPAGHVAIGEAARTELLRTE